MHTPSIVTASPALQQPVVDVITLAFIGDPMARWTLPDPSRYLAAMPQLVAAFGGRAFEVGSADLIDDHGGAALWLPPGEEPDTERLMALMDEHADPDRLGDALGVFEQMGHYHPHEPHWYLPLIGVDPAQQGHGYGAALLRHALERCDRDRLPAYLESSNPRNLSLYRRHGFESLGRIQVGGSPPVEPMLRPARRA